MTEPTTAPATPPPTPLPIEPAPVSKPALDSLTIQGLIVVALGVVARWLGAAVDEAALGAIVGDLWVVGGAIVAAIGRTRATLPLIWGQPAQAQKPDPAP